MTRIHTLVIGGGQAGLAMSRCLSDRRVDHVVLERGRVAERWRSERWESLRLLTPWEPGTYTLQITPVQELVAWFADVDRASAFEVLVEVRRG